MNPTDESFISWVHLSVGSDFYVKHVMPKELRFSPIFLLNILLEIGV
jgi:hypothetical protein